MQFPTPPVGSVISTILRHDKKQTSYKIALLRSINDVALNYPGLEPGTNGVAVPLLRLAEYWMAYYWPFVRPEDPIYQGSRSQLGDERRNDMAFRPELTSLRACFEDEHGVGAGPQDGFYLVHEMRIPRKRNAFSNALVSAYRKARRAVSKAIRMPVKYAGPGKWGIFDKPKAYSRMQEDVTLIPGGQRNHSCLKISGTLWSSFQTLSLWIEALCIHEWCLFTEQGDFEGATSRGRIFELLTARPDNRVSLSWERNRIDILLMEGRSFVCPYTGKKIRAQDEYDLDHLLPLSVYPINELWNLVPSDPQFNRNEKRDRLLEREALQKVRPLLIRTYDRYRDQPDLRTALHEDVEIRFDSVDPMSDSFSSDVAHAATSFVDRIARYRNLERFSL